MPSESTPSPGAAKPVVDAESSGDPWIETGESRTRVGALHWINFCQAA
jgi:hypothetical protein